MASRLRDNRTSLVLASAVLALTTCSALSGLAREDGDFIVDTSSIGQSENGVVRSEQILELGTPTANGLRLEGEQSLRYGNLDRAIMVLQRSVELAPMDMDGRILYAEALEKKLKRQPRDQRDPVLYNFLIKQWLFVGKKTEFADQAALGYNHLIGLCGSKPKRFERLDKFLNRVLIPEDGSQKVLIGGARQITK